VGEITRRDALRLAGVAAFGSTGCAAPPGQSTPRGITDADLDPLDLASRMIRFDTSHLGEGGVTLPHAQMLEQLWTTAGARTEIIPTPRANNAHFLARITGTGAHRPLLILGHSDVVNVERDRWTVDPFAAQVRDGWLTGRGALDMKGANAAFTAALLRHLREGARFDRDIIFLSDCDEEAGPNGTRWLAEQHYDKVDAGAVITEGGWLLAPPGADTPVIISITTQDKLGAALVVRAVGPATHSSRPSPDAAIIRLHRAVAKLYDYRPDIALTPLTRPYFEAWARASTDPQLTAALRLLLGATDRDQRNRAGAMVIARSPHPTLHNALLRHIITPVITTAGYRVNVQPGSAMANLNLRLVPGGVDVAQTVAEIRTALGEGVTVELSAPGQPGTQEQLVAGLAQRSAEQPSATDTDVYRALTAGATQSFPGVPVVATLFEAGASASPWRQRGVPVYGIYPYAVDDDTLGRMHGNDERLRVDALRRGTEMMYRVFARFRV